jgi:hypothetical protein
MIREKTAMFRTEFRKGKFAVAPSDQENIDLSTSPLSWEVYQTPYSL